jgi:hypothetical protein
MGQIVEWPLIPRRNFDEGRHARLPDGRIGYIREIAREIDAGSGRIITEDAHVVVDGVTVCVAVRRLAGLPVNV